MKVKVYSPESKEKETKFLELDSSIFENKTDNKVVLQAIRAQLANRRNVIANTKDRSEVSGGGRKPHRQKGTGRARAGSSRSPIWIGGGVTFGPTNNRNFRKKLPKKMLKNALLAVIASKIENKKLIVVSEFKFTEIATKKVQAYLEKLPLEEGKILIILSKTNVNFELSVANLPYVKTIQMQNINLFDLLKYDYCLTDIETMTAIEKIYKDKK